MLNSVKYSRFSGVCKHMFALSEMSFWFFMIACAFYSRVAHFSLLFVNCVHLWSIFVCFSTVLFSLSVEPLISPTVFTPTIRDIDMCADTVGPQIGYSRADLVLFWTPELRIDRKTRKTMFHHQLWCPRFRRFDDRYVRPSSRSSIRRSDDNV